MEREEALELLRGGPEGIADWNAERERDDFELRDLGFLDLEGANLRVANLRDLEIRGILRGADLTLADLRSTNLFDADLDGACVASADVGGTNFPEYLNGIVGLGELRHRAPSELTRSSVVNARGQLPESFLRGCGLAPWEVESVKLHDPNITPEEIAEIQNTVFQLRSSEPIQVRPVFISYAHADSAFVDVLHPKFRDVGINTWRDTHDMTSGPIGEQITEALQSRLAVLVLSERSLARGWVKNEIRKAIDLSREQDRHVLNPIAIDDTWKQKLDGDMRSEIKQYNVLDFSNWEDDESFDREFRKLAAGIRRWYT